MRKPYIQASIDIICVVTFILFVTQFDRISGLKYPLTTMWIYVYLALLCVMLLSKFVLYRRQNLLYFFFIFLIDLIYLVVFIDKFNRIMTQEFGVFLIIPGIVAILFSLRYKERYQLRLGVFLMAIGALLLLIFANTGG